MTFAPLSPPVNQKETGKEFVSLMSEMNMANGAEGKGGSF